MNGREVEALIDTGACRSVLSRTFSNFIQAEIRPLKPTDLPILVSADGYSLRVVGTTTVDVDLSSGCMCYEFYVLEELSQNVILGLDFLESNGAAMDFKTRTISFFDTVVMNYKPEANEESQLCLVSNCCLPPLSETIVPVRCRSHFQGIGLIGPWEGEKDHHEEAFGVARLLVEPENGKTVCRILNPTKGTIRLQAGRNVAIIEAVDPDLGITSENLEEATSVKEAEPKEKTDDEILADLGIKLENELDAYQQAQLKRLISANADIFAKSIADLPGTDLHYHRIDTGDAPPKRQRGYKHFPVAKREIERQTQEMLDNGIIEPSQSMWSARCILVKKKGGEMRMCIDYRQLNSVTKEISFPLPLMTDVFDAMSQSQPKIFTLLDLKSGFHQIPLEESSREKTAFSTHLGSFQYRVLPFGLMNAPSSFQMLMSHVFRGISFQYLIAYIDDLLIFHLVIKST